MCLIITGASNKIRSTLLDTAGMLADIYSSNADGIGFMYGTKNGLKVSKFLPKSEKDARAFIQRLPTDDRDVAIHFRMTTHGDTDLINCHPYDVVPGWIAMMHNGILSMGNAADTSKSDTWHFIRDYLNGPVEKHPELIYEQQFLTLLADYIGNNRFVFMNGEGRMSHVNFSQGIEHDGMWFSNTYAWTPSMLIPSYKSRYAGYAKYSGYNATTWDDEDDGHYYGNKYNGRTYPFTSPAKANPSAHSIGYNERDYEPADAVEEGEFVDANYMLELLMSADVDEVTELLAHSSEQIVEMTFAALRPVATQYSNAEDLRGIHKAVFEMVLDEDTEALTNYCKSSYTAPQLAAEVMCYYIDWVDAQVTQ